MSKITLASVKYTLHAFQRKFVRECHSDSEARYQTFRESETRYQTFREWLDESENMSEEMWSSILEEDESFDFQTKGNGMMTSKHWKHRNVNGDPEATPVSEGGDLAMMNNNQYVTINEKRDHSTQKNNF